MLVAVLSILAFASAVLAILSAYQKRRLTHYLFKPLTVVLIILIAFQAKHATTPFYRQAIIAGLIFSLAGDIFLMLPEDRFIPGLVSFLFAHVFYIAAFTRESGGALSFWTLVPFLLYGCLMLRVLWPHLGKLKLPVLIYMAVILAMGWTAAGRRLLTEQGGSLLAFLGAILFIASDSALALDKFRGRFRSAQLLILSTYFTAQWLIALST
ncbi:MAG TPA: lysoplasmalogenase [Pyrinomonadaceae bacterium]|nr:lysoplasmalogenase [Pyrinomonadaceae bacterium]